MGSLHNDGINPPSRVYPVIVSTSDGYKLKQMGGLIWFFLVDCL